MYTTYYKQIYTSENKSFVRSKVSTLPLSADRHFRLLHVAERNVDFGFPDAVSSLIVPVHNQLVARMQRRFE